MGLLFDLFKAEDAEVVFIVTGIEGLVRPVFLARLKVLEVFANGYTIRGFARCDDSALFRFEFTGGPVGVLVLNDFDGGNSADSGFIARVVVGHKMYGRKEP